MNRGGETVQEKVLRVYKKDMKAFLLECYEHNLSPDNIAKQLDSSTANVRRLLRLHGFNRFVKHKPMVKYMENPLFGTPEINQVNILSKSWV